MPTENEEAPVRTTVTIPKMDYAEIEKIAREKRVSVAWVVREAVAEYIVGAVDAETPTRTDLKKREGK